MKGLYKKRYRKYLKSHPLYSLNNLSYVRLPNGECINTNMESVCMATAEQVRNGTEPIRIHTCKRGINDEVSRTEDNDR